MKTNENWKRAQKFGVRKPYVALHNKLSNMSYYFGREGARLGMIARDRKYNQRG